MIRTPTDLLRTGAETIGLLIAAWAICCGFMFFDFWQGQ